MTIDEIIQVIKTWQKEFKELSEKDFINSVQIFENRCKIMGCSNPHPHGQIWAQETIPVEIKKKTTNFLNYYNNSTILEDYVSQELITNERVVYENENFIVVVPFWAVWPYETMIIAKQKANNILEMDEKMITNYAKAIQKELQSMINSLKFHFHIQQGFINYQLTIKTIKVGIGI
jgi:UDPglucose--hexose-1-phosphate uridylyltransferase